MNPLFYDHATDIDSALRLARQPGAKFIGGGTNLLDLVKGGIERPLRLVDINRLQLHAIEETANGGVRIGALARNSDAANHPLIRQRFPLIAQALLAGASPQLRNMATVGGNLMQRTRCHYFYDTGFDMCNKRTPGSGCAALDGINRMHAILGAGEQCIAVHPSDFAMALAALDAAAHVRGAGGERRIPFADFHRLPGDAPQRDTTLQDGELITAIEVPASLFAAHAHYLKVRDRASYAFALVSVAVEAAAQAARAKLVGMEIADAQSPLHGLRNDAVALANGWLASRADSARREPVEALLAELEQLLRARRPAVVAVIIEAEGGGAPGVRLLFDANSRIAYACASVHPAEHIAAIKKLARQVLQEKRSATATVGAAQGALGVFLEYIAPAPELFLFGAGHDAMPLAAFGKAMGFRVTVLDGRPAYAKAARFPHADRVRLAMPDSLPQGLAMHQEEREGPIHADALRRFAVDLAPALEGSA